MTRLDLAIRENGYPPFAEARGSAPTASSRCELRQGIGLCDECGQSKWPQAYMGYGWMICLDCIDAYRKAQNAELSESAREKQ